MLGKMVSFIARVCAISLVLITYSFPSMILGDEVVIDRQTNFKIGDFQCSNCKEQNSRCFTLPKHNQELTAGEVWQFFDEQGYDSLDRLHLNLDIQPISDDENFSLNSIQLKIEDPQLAGHLLTNVSMQGNSLTLPGYETYSFKPEAQLEVELGYDFMDRFSADSQEKIVFGYSSDSNAESTKPTFSLSGDSGFFSNWKHSFSLFAFMVFWVLVFVLLHRFTKPQVTESKPSQQAVPVTNNQRALSA